MRTRDPRLLLAALCSVAVTLAACPAFAAPTTVTTAPFTTPNTDSCPQRSTPPPPIDTSEAPAPGQSAPAPLPIPSTPIGGGRMGECGVVTPAGAPAAPMDISATAWLVSDLDTGEVLAAKDPHGRYRPASTIKVLLAAVALRTLDLNKVVTGTQEDANADGTRVGIGPGGQYTNRQLMQALIMASGNDAAHAIATQLGGDAATIAKMNELAKSLHASDTRAASPSGLDGPGMSTSAYDLSLLFREAMTIPLFAQLIHTEQIDFPGYPKSPGNTEDKDHPGFAIGNDNHLLFEYDGALGGKTGYTDDARQTFVAGAQRDGRRLAVTLLKADVQPLRPWEQAARLLDYGFALPRGTAVGHLPNAATESAQPPVALATPPRAAAGTAHDGRSGLRTALIVGGIILVAVFLLGARRVARRGR
ncbi:D-alanyl-D-alanine carboxypeptidase [Nocardia panacis]|uniref:D-alanyl-D-alanine carboxypeptidase n=1 Tax=Nocardia panacis TaxID=2340916 RepID=A0A3A4KQR0_9NOCA|nr:D-alanyl-D-alanine carboxypeptidase family protein [Nocardia panacis]RJO72217.1 D-alanyl-D-alanine carboxypeptidase [Nocardia panacis]